MKYIVYVGNNEAIITTKKKEAETIQTFFGSDEDVIRDINEYDRDEVEDCAVMFSSLIRRD